MNINLHIERLVIDAALLGSGRREAVQAAVEAELARLLTDGTLPTTWPHGGAIPALTSTALPVGQPGNPAHLGTQIGQAVYGAMSNPVEHSSR